ncbi:TIGR03621 family F420-dependent LLM class oxidoreductase [Mycobacteroides chelonae]|uniref:Luciferase-like domain-containing protein n=1 Tax=Mycobacteroides chelonae TaxID=1774 RepID=A0A1S1M6D1_MYCCH|nr:TIGR03621 family F420-dependent LLM class oxidoreductase [Mycobacteroides chelonae]OHU78836.1 hypothetical protein BKG84_10950 [Mycobacteroides chelonae]QQG85961.1 TIGR03621 family F420-dependent LLM class oxidoreductase [Mycobacteroides chelonae]QQG90778.1 TIGR03621 family F420-dependent LLM class oxidoreductase [Mycobacteroides chelonae]
MVEKQIRFGVNINAKDSGGDALAKLKDVEAAGVDIALVSDHLGAHAPFPLLAAAAASTSTVRLGTLVLDALFYRSALLARDIAEVDLLSGGRLEVGLGAGYVKEELDLVGLPFPGPSARVDTLANIVTELRKFLCDPHHVPAPIQSPPPIMIAGAGDRILTLAAKHAEIVNLATMAIPTFDRLRDRVDFIGRQAGDRTADLELSLGTLAFSIREKPDLSYVHALFARQAPGITEKEVLNSPGVLYGSPAHVAQSIQRLRDEFGITYVTFNDPDLDDLNEVIEEVRKGR